jgi:cytochrome c-type biogenesis protein CcmH/NrfG
MDLKNEWRWLAPLMLVAGLVFANALAGDFVYDDKRQIIRNLLIQEPTLYGKALTSDVWAFKADGAITTSNYWRPTFVAWLIFNFRLFGIHPFGWHLLNILLHAGVCALAYLLLRRWNLSKELALAVTLIFAVHPLHTESVAWISGSPDLIFSLALLGSFFFAAKISARTEDRPVLYFGLSLILYGIALGAKETGILCFPIYWLILREQKVGSVTANKSLPFSFVYAAMAAAYFVLRWMVIGRISLPQEGAASFGRAILTAPAIFAFYLKQIVFPLRLGANYSLRPVTEVDFGGFVLPLLVSVLALAVLWLMARRSAVQTAGFGLFILPLLPAMNASGFIPEQIVHDRYLYLPLLGFLIVIVPSLVLSIEKFLPKKGELATFTVAAFIALPLSWQTFHYNRTWLNDLSLWEHAVKVDPTSSFNWLQFGVCLSEKGRIQEAVEAFDKALAIHPLANAYVGQARSLLAQQEYERAIRNLQTVRELPPEKVNPYVLYQTYETLAMVYLEQKKFDEAVNSLEESRKRLPIYYAALTEKLAVVLYNAGQKDLALKELEQARTQARIELLPESKSVFLRLGILYAEQNRNDDARTALKEYLRLTASIKDKFTIANRAQASSLLKTLN